MERLEQVLARSPPDFKGQLARLLRLVDPRRRETLEELEDDDVDLYLGGNSLHLTAFISSPQGSKVAHLLAPDAQAWTSWVGQVTRVHQFVGKMGIYSTRDFCSSRPSQHSRERLVGMRSNAQLLSELRRNGNQNRDPGRHVGVHQFCGLGVR